MGGSDTKQRAEAYIDGAVKGRTRVALIRSLTALLGEPSSDEKGMYWNAFYEERLKELDLKIARADRSRRVLVRERTRTEKMLGEIERIMKGANDSSLQQLTMEHGSLTKRLDEVDLSIAELDRSRRHLRRERKRLEISA